MKKTTENKHLETFIDTMSYEIRSSMNVIVGLTDLMIEDDIIPFHAKENIQMVNMAAHTLMKNINDLLNVSKTEGERWDFPSRPYDSADPEPAKLMRPDLSYVRALVVDDSTINLAVAEDMLIRYKMQVDCITSGREAVDRIAAGEPVYNAVFMDYMMPEMDGMEATALIRDIGTEYAENIPIIALTANAVAGNEKIFLNNGFNAFLSKPIDAMVLDSILHLWIQDASE